MTYEIFKQEIENLGLKFFSLNMVVGINDDKDFIFNKPLCYVGINKIYDVYITKYFYKLNGDLQKKVFKLVNELALTPLDKRGYLKEFEMKEVWYGII